MTTDAFMLDAPKVSPPWAADNFQVSKYGSRYYSDTLPPCDLIADPHSEPVPGFSSLKPSKPFRKSVTVGDRKYTVPLDWFRAGEWMQTTSAVIVADMADRDENALHDFYKACHAQRDRDFARGHAIHSAAEAALVGQGVLNVNPDAEPYIPHLTKWITDNVTDVHAIEAVVFGDGYGGTGDAWVNVRGVSVYLDWKSRGADSSHGIYEDEIAQGGAYTSARYCIVPSDDRQTAVRAPLPAASYGLVLSLRPDGVEEFWYDLAYARDAFNDMHDAYRHASSSGKTARAAKVADPTTVQETAKRRKKAAPATPPPRIAPDEGRTGVNVDSLRDKYKALDPAARSWVEAKRAEAQAAGVDFHLSTATERRAWIMSALCNLAAAEVDDDDTVKAICRFVTSDDAREYFTGTMSFLIQWPAVTAGHAVGSLDVVQAKAFRDTALVFAAGMGVLEFDDLGAKVAA
jgi:hypothetical protein